METQSPKQKELVEKALLQLVNELFQEIRPGQIPESGITLDSSFDRDLGLDSLSRIELLGRISANFGVQLPERSFLQIDTPREIIAALPLGVKLRQDLLREDIQLPKLSELPIGAKTLMDVLDWHAERSPTRRCLIVLPFNEHSTETEISFQGLKMEAEALAAGLQSCDVRPGASIAVMLPTSPEYFYAFFGILYAGCVPVPIYPPARASQIEEHLSRHAKILENSESVLLLAPEEARPVSLLLQSKVPSLKRIATIPELREAKGIYRRIPARGGDLAFLQYTSGSTGQPKGVMLTHANLLHNIFAMGTAIKAGSNDIFVSWLPLYHDMGLIGAWLGSLYYAAQLVVMSPLSFLAAPQRWLETIHRFRGTLTAAPNFAYELCLKRIDTAAMKNVDLSSLRLCFNGAEPVSAATIEGFRDKFGPLGLRREALTPVYGLAECCVGLTFPPLGRGFRIDTIERERYQREGDAVPTADSAAAPMRVPGCGFPLPGHEIKIVDAARRELPERTEGEIWFRGPSASAGYKNNEEATATLKRDGWLSTGDLGYLAEGELFITGRVKDIIIRAGRKLVPAEIEETVGRIPGIRKGCVAAFGTSAEGTERLIVVAETYSRNPADLEPIRREVNNALVALAGSVADDLVFVPPHAIPKTSSGKLRRSALKDSYLAGKPLDAASQTSLRLLRLRAEASLVAGRQRIKTIGQRFYSVYVWCLFVLAVIPFLFCVFLAPGRKLFWSAAGVILRALAWGAGIPLEIEGKEKLPPEGERCVLVANHSSYLDVFALTALLPRPVRFVAKAELRRNLVLRPLLARIGVEYVERFAKDQGVEDARRLKQRVQEGKPLLFFPEGTFTRQAGLQPFTLGAFLTAAEAGAKLLPITIQGTRQILREYDWWPRRGKIKLSVGAPLFAHGEKGNWQAALQLKDEARKEILQHSGEPDLALEGSAVERLRTPPELQRP